MQSSGRAARCDAGAAARAVARSQERAIAPRSAILACLLSGSTQDQLGAAGSSFWRQSPDMPRGARRAARSSHNPSWYPASLVPLGRILQGIRSALAPVPAGRREQLRTRTGRGLRDRPLGLGSRPQMRSSARPRDLPHVGATPAEIRTSRRRRDRYRCAAAAVVVQEREQRSRR